MLKQLTLLIATTTMTIGIASATTPATTSAKIEATSPVELTLAEMDTLSAGSYYYYNPYYVSSAQATAAATALGRFSVSASATSAFTAYNVSESLSASSAYSSN